jgi:hypothetical protein
MTEPTTVADELAAMRRIAAALEKLDPKAQNRVVRWVGERYGSRPTLATGGIIPASSKVFLTGERGPEAMA